MFRFGEMYERLGEIQKSHVLGKMTPFRIIGNVYYVGSYQASAHLIDTGDGLILIDTGYAGNAEMLVESIQALGFSLSDIKYIVHTHWHRDHTEATPAIVAASGARTLISYEDAERAKQYFAPDILVDDGDRLELGKTSILFLLTPGHTKGTISLFFDTEENGQSYRVGMFGGAGINTLVPDRFEFDGCREAYRASINRLRGEKVDVFIGNHVWNNDTENKGKHLLATGENLFIDDALWLRFLNFCEERLDKVIETDP